MSNRYPENTSSSVDRDKLVEEMLDRVKYIAYRIHDRLPGHVPFDDLVQAGIVGLLDAAQKFDPTRNIQFTTYAKFRIHGAIVDSLRDGDWASRKLRRDARQIEQAHSKLSNSLGRSPSEEEVARELKMELTQYQELLGNLNGLNLGSLEGCTMQGDEIVTYVPYDPEPDPYFLCARSEMKAILAETLSDLPKKERDVLVLYYYEELTLREIAEILGLVESRISQLRAAALTRLRARLQGVLAGHSPQVAQAHRVRTGAAGYCENKIRIISKNPR